MMNGTAPGRNDVLHALNGMLERDSALSRCCAAGALARLEARDPRSRRRLIGLLQDPDPDVRMHAAAALGHLRVAEATEPLLDIVAGDFDGDVRIEAVTALARIASEKAVEPLIHCVEEDGYPHLDQLVDDMDYGACWEVQSRALAALGEIGDQRAVAPVIEFLRGEEHEELQESGYRVLAGLNSRKSQQFLVAQLRAGNALARRRAAEALAGRRDGARPERMLAPRILRSLAEALRDPDAGVRIAAARTLGDSGSPSAASPLLGLLDDPDPRVRGEAAAILGKLREPRALARLHALLDDPEPSVRRQAGRVLGDIADPASRDVLGALLDGQDDLLYEAVLALGKLGPSGFEDKLGSLLANRAVHFAVRVQAALVLGEALKKQAAAQPQEPREDSGEAPGPRPMEILLAAVGDEDERLACAALSALAEAVPGEAARPLIELLHGAFPRPAEGAAGAPETAEASPGSGAKPRLDDGLSRMGFELPADGDPKASTLAAILERAAESEQAARDEEPGKEPQARTPGAALRSHAARLLGGLADPDSEAVTALMEAARREAVDLQREALLALGRIADEQALPVVLEGLRAEPREVRLAALDALGGFERAVAAQERLVVLLDDPDPCVRQRAVETLGSTLGPQAGRHLCRALHDEDLEVCRTALRAVSEKTHSAALSDRIVTLMFDFSGELREAAAAALRRAKDFSGAARLLATLEDADQEEVHWICIDALAELYARQATAAN